MKCEIVKDLMPLYTEGLCSEETTEEIKEHLKQCEHCNNIIKEMDIPMESLKTEENISIEPMKKVKRKLQKKNSWILAISVLAAILIGSISYLSYNQINRSGMSFERIYEYVHFQKIGKDFAKGNLESLLDCLTIPEENYEYVTYAKTAYDNDLDAYIQDAKEDVKAQYKDLFEGKKLTLKDVTTEYVPDLKFNVTSTSHLMVGLIYEVEDVTYVLRLERNKGKKFYITDGFVEFIEAGYDETTEQPEDTKQEQSQPIEENNNAAPLLSHHESVFRSLQPYSDDIFFLIKNAIRHFYKQDNSKDTPMLFTSYFITEELLNADTTLKDAYSQKIQEQFKELARMGYVLSDADFLLQGYDKEKHMYRYEIIYTFTCEGKNCYLLMDCHRNSNVNQDYLILNPDTIQVFGDKIPDEIKEKIASVWK